MIFDTGARYQLPGIFGTCAASVGDAGCERCSRTLPSLATLPARRQAFALMRGWGGCMSHNRPHSASSSSASIHELPCLERCWPALLRAIRHRARCPLVDAALGALLRERDPVMSVKVWATELRVPRAGLALDLTPGSSPGRLIRSCSVLRAMDELWRQSALRAGDALDAMGYQSRAHAFVAFKGATGVTPRRFWQQCRPLALRHASPCLLLRCPLGLARPVLGLDRTTVRDALAEWEARCSPPPWPTTGPGNRNG